MDLVSFQIGAGELDAPADDDIITNLLEKVLDRLAFNPGVDVVAERLASRPHHMEGMYGGAG